MTESLPILAMRKFRPLVSDNCLGDTTTTSDEMMECEQMRDPVILCSPGTEHLFVLLFIMKRPLSYLLSENSLTPKGGGVAGVP